MSEPPAGKCSIVIPAYNEAERIPRLLAGLSAFSGKIIVICDGTDATATLVRAYAAQHPEQDLRCVEYPTRLGKGGGVMEGIRMADTPYIGFMDADASTSPDEMMRLFGALADSDAAIASRWVSGASVPVRQGLLRRIQSRVFNGIVHILFSLPFQDTQCGAKVFRKKALDDVLPLMRSGGFEFDVELLWRLSNAGYRILEVPTVWENRGDSRVGLPDACRMFARLLKVRFM
ncbi:MAG: glycosyltransferase family 2 protein [Methanomicrobiales archaeon]|nr:glycosyltransferase family 2 protein [Methanomicrobiales archaeon]